MSPRTKKKTIRYVKPCMAGLPQELGRQIIHAIMNTPPFDRTAFDKECARVKRRLAKIVAEYKKNEAAGK